MDETMLHIRQLMTQYPDGVELILLKKQNSIGVIFSCHDINGLKSLEEMFVSGRLKVSLETIFSYLINSNGESWKIEVDKLVWLLGNYNHCMYLLLAKIG